MSKRNGEVRWRYLLLSLGALILVLGLIVRLLGPEPPPGYYPQRSRFPGAPIGAAPLAIFVGGLLLWLGVYGWNREKK